MTIQSAEFSSIVVNSTQVVNAIRISIIKYIFEDVLEAVTSTIEIELEPRYIPKLKRGDFIELKLKWKNRTTDINSGTFKIDDVLTLPGAEAFNVGGTAYDYSDRKPDNVQIVYGGSRLVDVVGSQYAYFGLNPILPSIGIPNVIAGFYSARANTIGEAVQEMNQRFPSERFRIFTLIADSRIEMLKLVARMYGYVTNLKFGSLIFLSYDIDILRRSPVLTITPAMVLPNIEFREKTKGIYGQVLVNYAVISGDRITTIRGARVWDVSTQRIASAESIPTTEEIYPRLSEAILRGIGLLIEANADRFAAYLEIKGSPLLTAGVTVELFGFNQTRDINPDGKNIDGNWVVVKARHRFDAHGWFTYLELWKADNVQIGFNNDGS